MPKRQNRPNLRSKPSKTRAPQSPFDAFAPANFAAAEVSLQENGFSVVVATAQRDRLEPALAPVTKDTTDATAESASSLQLQDQPPAAETTSPAAKLPTLYRWSDLKDSVLKGPRRSALWDVVTNYRADDRIDAPETIITTQITEASGSIRKLNPGQIHAKGVGGESLEANTARAFLYTGPNKTLQNGVFVVFNDSRPGYQHRSDSLIFLEGFSFGAGTGASAGDVETGQTPRTILFWQAAPAAPPSSDTTPAV